MFLFPFLWEVPITTKQKYRWCLEIEWTTMTKKATKKDNKFEMQISKPGIKYKKVVFIFLWIKQSVTKLKCLRKYWPEGQIRAKNCCFILQIARLRKIASHMRKIFLLPDLLIISWDKWQKNPSITKVNLFVPYQKSKKIKKSY